MTEIGNPSTALRDKGISVIQAVLIPLSLVVLDAGALVASITTSSRYDRYAVGLDNDCGRAVSTPFSMALVMWMAVALSAASAVTAVVVYRRLRSRDTGRDLAGLVRVLCFLLGGAGIIITALCIVAIVQRQPFTVTCSGP